METKVNKSVMLMAGVILVNDKLLFNGHVEGNPPIAIDYIAPLGDDAGYTSLELLLMSLASCQGSSILTFLRRMQKPILGCEIQATGIRNETHPTGFKRIVLEVKVSSPDLLLEDVTRVIKLSEETYCPVWAMVKGNVEVETKVIINKFV